MSEERIVIKVGPDKYDVILGRKLNREPLTRSAADAAGDSTRSSSAAPRTRRSWSKA
jgi:hypothetical protein